MTLRALSGSSAKDSLQMTAFAGYLRVPPVESKPGSTVINFNISTIGSLSVDGIRPFGQEETKDKRQTADAER